MNKIILLLVGFSINLIAMDVPPQDEKDAKQKIKIELIEHKDEEGKYIHRNAPSSGSIAPSMSRATTVTSDGKTSDSSSSGTSDMAQIDLDKDGHVSQLAEGARHRKIKVKVASDTHDDDILKQLVIAKREADAANAEVKRLATAAEKQKKRESIILSLNDQGIRVPALPLADLEKGLRQPEKITIDEINDMIAGIKEATNLDLSRISDALKEEIRTLCETPNNSNRFNAEEKKRIITALVHMRQCASQRSKTTSRVETLKRRPNTPEELRDALRAEKITEMFEDYGINLEDINRAFKDLVHSTTADKLERIDTVKGRWKLGSILTAGIAVISWGVTAYSQLKGNSSSTPVCPPTNTTFPL